ITIYVSIDVPRPRFVRDLPLVILGRITVPHDALEVALVPPHEERAVVLPRHGIDQIRSRREHLAGERIRLRLEVWTVRRRSKARVHLRRWVGAAPAEPHPSIFLIFARIVDRYLRLDPV